MTNQREQPKKALSRRDENTTPVLSVRKKIFFSGICTIVLLIALEVLCRVLSLGGVGSVSPVFSDWHDSPDGRVFWVIRGPGYNAEGMRDREHSVEKPPGVTRIVCLGDSVTEGWGSRADWRWPVVLESFMKQMGLDVEVILIAASGWSTLQEAAAYEQLARKYQPDFVFLGFCLNDVGEMHNNLENPPPRIVGWFIRHSALVRTLVSAERRQVRKVEELFVEPSPESVDVGWQRVESELERLAELVRADGATLSVLVFPFRIQLTEEPMTTSHQEFEEQPLPQRRLTRFCQEQSIPSLDLLPAFREAGSDAFIDESHFSALGAKTVAEEVIRWGRTGCALCGYDLSGVTAGHCPRCGAAIQR